jgi:hypothetical protein
MLGLFDKVPKKCISQKRLRRSRTCRYELHRNKDMLHGKIPESWETSDLRQKRTSWFDTKQRIMTQGSPFSALLNGGGPQLTLTRSELCSHMSFRWSGKSGTRSIPDVVRSAIRSSLWYSKRSRSMCLMLKDGKVWSWRDWIYLGLTNDGARAKIAHRLDLGLLQ